MGKKTRGKFERIHSEDEHGSSSEEESIIEDEAMDESISQNEINSSQNENNSSNRGQVKGNTDAKFLITRSKRQYSKREVVIPEKKLKTSKDGSLEEDSKFQRFEKINKPVKDINHNLDEKIVEANKYLEDLNRQIRDRESEIAVLKSRITGDRRTDEPTNIGEKVVKDSNMVEDLELPHPKFDTVTTPRSLCENQTRLVINQPNPTNEMVQNFSDDNSSDETMEELDNWMNKNPAPADKSRKRKSRSRSRSRGRKQTDAELTRDNPAVKRLVERMVSEQVEAELKKRTKIDETAVGGANKGISSNINNLLNNTPRFKSPSDSTLYTPAVERASPGKLRDKQYVPITEDWVRQARQNGEGATDDKNCGKEESSVINQVSKFISDIRFTSGPDSCLPGTSGKADDGNPHPPNLVQQQQRARSAAEKAILDAERFKAQVQRPTRGTEIQFNNTNNSHYPGKADQIRYLRYLEQDDDDFFHTTCHIEQSIRERIEKGLFVELEKLLQKRTQFEPKDNRLQLINRDGMSYFVPYTDRESKIDNIKRWEQAFRVYTTIYCGANPTRAGEILQYVDVIHRAAATFNWDNVARYDYVFRQLMAAKPHRSWAKVYTQMWNFTLNEPLRKFQDSSKFSNGNHYQNKSNGKKKDNVCWKYNKGSCSYGKNCRFDHVCSYCGNQGHGASNCLKKQNKKGDKKNETK